MRDKDHPGGKQYFTPGQPFPGWRTITSELSGNHQSDVMQLGSDTGLMLRFWSFLAVL